MKLSENQITIGQLINKLKTIDPDKRVYYDWLRAAPTRFNSYRGYYEDVALGATCERYESKTVGELLAEAEAIMGTALEGYKGGYFKVTPAKPLWVANYGSSTGWAIVGIDENEFYVTLKTELIDP